MHEDINYKATRGLDKRQIAALAAGAWICRSQNLLITSAAGCGKTWLACASTSPSPKHLRALLAVPRIIEELRIAHGDGSYIKLFKTIAKASLTSSTTGA